MIVRYPEEEHLEPSKSRLTIWIEQHLAGWKTLSALLLIFLLSRLAFYAAAFFGYWQLPDQGLWPGKMDAGGPWWLAMHWRWDAIHYYNIAIGGYRPNPATTTALQSEVGLLPAFFPLLPLLIRATAFVVGLRTPALLPLSDAAPAVLWSGVLLANGAALLAFWLLHQLACAESGDSEMALRAALYAAIFPLAFYYNVPYAEPLFLAASIGAFLEARRGRWLRAGLWAACATAARPVGILLLPALALEIGLSWRRGELGRKGLLRALLGLLLAPTGLLLYMLALWQLVGDALAFLHVQANWRRQLVFPWTTLGRCIWYVFHPGRVSQPGLYARTVLDTLIVVGFLLVLVVSARLWRPAYTLYGVLLFLVLLATPMRGELVSQSMGRNAMIFFPVYITLARWGRRPAIHQTILMTWLPLFGIFTALFVRYYFVE